MQQIGHVGFIRTPSGQHTVLDVKDAGSDGYSGQGRYPQGINNLGEVFGYNVDANDVFHGSVRTALRALCRTACDVSYGWPMDDAIGKNLRRRSSREAA